MQNFNQNLLEFITYFLNIVSIILLITTFWLIYRKNFIRSIITGFLSFSTPFIIFILVGKINMISNCIMFINLSVFFIATFFIAIRASFFRKEYKSIFGYISKSGGILILLFMVIMIIQITSSAFLFIDVSYITYQFFVYMFVVIFIFPVIMFVLFLLNKKIYEKISEITNKISGAYIISLIFLILYIFLANNSNIINFYSPATNQIITKYDENFRVENVDEAKFIANKLKNGKINTVEFF